MLISEIRRLLDKYRPLLLGLSFLTFYLGAAAQTYSPSTCCTVSNKSYGAAQAVSTDGRSWFYDASNFVMRDYNGTAEVISYLNLTKYRQGHFPIFVHTGGVLQGNGVWLGGHTLVYWFKDSTDNASLVRWYTDSTGLPGAPFYSVANNLAEGNAGLIKGNLSLDNVDNTSDATKNAASVSLTNHTIDGNLNTLQNIGNASLSNSTIGLSITANPASDIGVITTPAALGASLVANIPNSTASARGALIGSDWNHFNLKLDSFHISNDSVYGCVNGTCTLQGVISGIGTVGSGLYDSAGKVIWGEPVGQAGAPAQLTGNSEVPFNAFSMEYLESTDPDSTRVIFNDTSDNNVDKHVPIKIIQKKPVGYYNQWIPPNYGQTYVSGHRPGLTGIMHPGKITGGMETAVSNDVMPDNVFNFIAYNEDAQGNRLDTTDAGLRMALETNYLNTIGGFNDLTFEMHWPEIVTFGGTRLRPHTFYINKRTGYVFDDRFVNQTEWHDYVSGNLFTALLGDGTKGTLEFSGDGNGDGPDGQVVFKNSTNGFQSFVQGFNNQTIIGNNGNGTATAFAFRIFNTGNMYLLGHVTSNPADWKGMLIGDDDYHTTLAPSSAVVDIRGNTKGVLIPRMSLSEFNAISSPAPGLHVQLNDSLYHLAVWDSTKIVTYATTDQLSNIPLRYKHLIFIPTTGQTVNLVNNQYNIINPAGTIATLTVNLPSSPVDNDVVYIKYTQAVATVTYGNGTVVDGIISPTAGTLVVLTYDNATSSWY